MSHAKIYMGNQEMNRVSKEITEGFVEIDHAVFYQIENYPAIAPFFMTLTSSSNHWMFISSNGGLTAGRVNAESALFPYYTVDKITQSAGHTGPLTIILATKHGRTSLWKPFTKEGRDAYDIRSRLSKNVPGNILKFEEINVSLGLSFSYCWMTSKQYGLVRKAVISNIDDSSVDIALLDGLQNVLPAGVESQVQNQYSCLLNGYKRTELDDSGLGLMTLSATLTDLAEPSESLKANTVWQCGLDVDHYLLSTNQIDAFSRGGGVYTEKDQKGDQGCYFVESAFCLPPQENKVWMIVADVDKDLCAVNALRAVITGSGSLIDMVQADVDCGSEILRSIISQNDGMEATASLMNSTHHQANVLFNAMRGGYFYKSYTIRTADFIEFVRNTNRGVHKQHLSLFRTLNPEVAYEDLLKEMLQTGDKQLERIGYAYLPLTFSRRHGDPSRPWNKFSIETEMKNGSAKLDYQGNWRDIFQNWEALCFSYPEYLKHVIGTFLNASTKDGYNPYKIAKSGIEWECPEPENPWANIGYWSDHQIIYLLKLLEMYQQHKPGHIQNELNEKRYTFAHVPYEIKSFAAILEDPYETIHFNEEKDQKIKAFAQEIGADGKMLHGKDGSIILATLSEKLLIHLLTKLGNFIPEGGIWMNTQRPEWNDANNALVGKGISVVTLAYLRRYITFMIEIYSTSTRDELIAGSDLVVWFNKIAALFSQYESMLDGPVTNTDRYRVVESLGLASEEYRNNYYAGVESDTSSIKVEVLLAFLRSSLKCVDDSLYKNRRGDKLFHSYNTLEIRDGELIIHPLYEMLEGQVAILSSRMLSPEEADETFDALRKSALYREDQNTYMLYPNRELPGFMAKNIISHDQVVNNVTLKQLIDAGNTDLITQDVNGAFHFNGDFHNVKQVRAALEQLGLGQNKEIESLFEKTFDHQSFTGRSGTFFAYEGLGSVYWHMVSKLLLAAQENLFWAIDQHADERTVTSLKNRYYDIRKGLGYNKTASKYGAFPFDPYSHTPFGKGAKQPGMTGQVKEEVITRMAEMGIRIKEGAIVFDSTLLDEQEFLATSQPWAVVNNSSETLELELPEKSVAGTHCQTPFIITRGEAPSVTVHFSDGEKTLIHGNTIPVDISSRIFKRDHAIRYVTVTLG